MNVEEMTVMRIMNLIRKANRSIYEEYSNRNNIGWVVCEWNMIINDCVCAQKELRVDNYLYEINKAYEKRLYVIAGKEGSCAYLDSTWCLLNLEKNVIEKDTNYGKSLDKVLYNVHFDNAINIDIDDMKIEDETHFVVTEELIDNNKHLNNYEYIKAVCESLIKHDIHNIKRLCIKYRKQAYINEKIKLIMYKKSNRIVYCFKNEKNEAISKVAVIVG